MSLAAGSASRPRAGESARSLVYTILGEYVYPGNGSARTETFLRTLGALGVEESATRQALNRIALKGGLHRERSGREVRWVLTDIGRHDSEAGTTRLHGFAGVLPDWDGRWLMLVTSVPEDQRELRRRLRRDLTWAGFGSLPQGVWLSPDVALEREANDVVTALGLEQRTTTFIARCGSLTDEHALVAEAWDLGAIQQAYDEFIAGVTSQRVRGPEDAFVAHTRLVHEWRRFPFVDPGLPETLLPRRWIGRRAKALFDEKVAAWRAPAREFYGNVTSAR